MSTSPYQLLNAPLGQQGSARLRYGAAMSLYQSGHITADVLEVYRSCASLDAQDPNMLLAEYGLQNPAALIAILSLVAEIDRYLVALPGREISDVRQGLTPALNARITPQISTANPVITAHLDTALDAAKPQIPALATAIHAAAPHLKWITYDGYDLQKIGPDFANNHAYTSLVGQDAPILVQGFDLGLFLIAPHVLYRDHHHAAPELYAPLTGPHGWRFGPTQPLIIKPAHQPIWNEPNAPHLTKVGPVPFLCIFAWTRDVDGVAQVIPAKDWPELEAMRIRGDDGL